MAQLGGRCATVDLWLFKFTTFTLYELLYKLGILLFHCLWWFIDILYQLFMAVGSARMFQNDTLATFTQRVYILLGIVMLFFVTYQLFQMMLDPDKLTGKGDGSGKDIVMKVVTSIVLISLVSFLFNTAYEIQGIILGEDVLGRLFFSNIGSYDEKESKENTNMYLSGGKLVGTSVFKAFFYPHSAVDTMNYNDFKVRLYQPLSTEEVTPVPTYKEIIERVEKEGPFFLSDLHCDHLVNGNAEKIDFPWVLAVAVAAFVVWALTSYVLALGLRAVQLGFLQLIAPIPIAMRILPKQKKNFDSWLKTTLSSFTEIFIRIAIIYFSIYVISLVSKVDLLAGMWDGQTQPSGFIMFFAQAVVIFGIFMFIMKAPGLLKTLGLTGEGGDYGINPLKRIRENTPLTRAAGALGGALGAAGANLTRRRYEKDEKTGKWKDNGGKWRRLGGTIAGAASGAYHGYQNGGAKDARMLRSMLDARNTAVQRREDRKVRKQNKADTREYYETHGGTKGYVQDRFQSFMGNVGAQSMSITHRIEAGNEMPEIVAKLQNIYNGDEAYADLRMKAAQENAMLDSLTKGKVAAEAALTSSRLDNKTATGELSKLTQMKTDYTASVGRVDQSKEKLEKVEAEHRKAVTEHDNVASEITRIQNQKTALTAAYDAQIATAGNATLKANLEQQKAIKTAELDVELTQLNDQKVVLENNVKTAGSAYNIVYDAHLDVVNQEQNVVQADIANKLSTSGFTTVDSSTGQTVAITTSNLIEAVNDREKERTDHEQNVTDYNIKAEQAKQAEELRDARGLKLQAENKDEIASLMKKAREKLEIIDANGEYSNALFEDIIDKNTGTIKKEKENTLIQEVINPNTGEMELKIKKTEDLAQNLKGLEFEDIINNAQLFSKNITEAKKQAENEEKQYQRFSKPKDDKKTDK